MKKQGILNPALSQTIAALGHTELLVIADAGLPIPSGVPVVDLALVRGIPSFLDTLRAVCGELVVEGCVLAQEMECKSSALYRETAECLGGLPMQKVSHEEFKRLIQGARAVVRTGEATPYANVILRSGVNF